MIRKENAEDVSSQQTALVETLRIAVPLHMAELATRPSWALPNIAAEAAQRVGELGDRLQFPGKIPKKGMGKSAEAFNALAEGLAAAALIDGANAYGIHWCRRHPAGITGNECP